MTHLCKPGKSFCRIVHHCGRKFPIYFIEKIVQISKEHELILEFQSFVVGENSVENCSMLHIVVHTYKVYQKATESECQRANAYINNELTLVCCQCRWKDSRRIAFNKVFHHTSIRIFNEILHSSFLWFQF